MLDRIRRYFGFFDSRGRKFSLKHLCGIRPFFLMLELKTQALYADRNTIHMAKSDHYTADLVTGILKFEGKSERLDTTTIGNMAYLSLYHKDVFVRVRSREILDRVQSEENEILKKEPPYAVAFLEQARQYFLNTHK